eukprot:ctg_433.g258
MEDTESLILQLFDVGAVKFGRFTLKSGIESPLYVDLRVTVSHPPVLEAVARRLSAVLEAAQCEYDVLCGVPYTALPFATVMSVRSGKPMVMRRKESKAYGLKRSVEARTRPHPGDGGGVAGGGAAGGRRRGVAGSAAGRQCQPVTTRRTAAHRFRHGGYAAGVGASIAHRVDGGPERDGVYGCQPYSAGASHCAMSLGRRRRRPPGGAAIAGHTRRQTEQFVCGGGLVRCRRHYAAVRADRSAHLRAQSACRHRRQLDGGDGERLARRRRPPQLSAV